MRQLRLPLALAALTLLAFATRPATAAEHRIGIGAHYWRTIDELIDDEGSIADDGLAWLASYQYVPGPIRFEIDLEYFDEGFGGSTTEAWSPQAYVLVGAGVYGGLGVGVTVSDGFVDGDISDPFYAARLGINFEPLPGMHLDVAANYRFDAWSELEGQLDDPDTDTLTLGAIVRVAF